MNYLGIMYFDGTGVSKDEKLGIQWLQKAADLNNDKAMVNLGVMYLMGISVPQDKELGIQWLQKAADLGSGEAWAILSEIQ